MIGNGARSDTSFASRIACQKAAGMTADIAATSSVIRSGRAMHAGVLPNALRVLRVDRPNVHVALYNLNSAEQLEDLRQRSLDIALVSEPPVADDPDLLGFQVLDDPMLLALPEHHPLANNTTLTPADLADQEWIGVQPRQDAASRDDFVSACIRAGFTPDIRMEATEPFTALGVSRIGAGHRHDPERPEPQRTTRRGAAGSAMDFLHHAAVGRLAPDQFATAGGNVQESADRTINDQIWGAHKTLWRGGLPPLGRAATPKPAATFIQVNRVHRIHDCFAAERG
jgi:hypothetical protein